MAILLIARIIIWTLRRTLNTSLGTNSIEEGRRYTIIQISKYLIYTVALVIALETIGVKVTAILAAYILIIMPNHKMTNETVINLTHSEDTTRFSVRVGVAYGSDTALVKKILLQIAADHPES